MLRRFIFAAVPLAALSMNACSGPEVRLTAGPPAGPSGQAVLGASGTTLVVTTPQGGSLTIVFPALTAGAGAILYANVAIAPQSSSAARRRRNDQPFASVATMTLHAYVHGDITLATIPAGTQAYLNQAMPLKLIATFPQGTAGGPSYTGSEEGRVTDTVSSTGSSTTCSSTLSAPDNAGTGNDHNAPSVQLDNTLNVSSPTLNDGTVDATFVVSETTGSQARHRNDAGGESCSASTDLSNTFGPSPSPEPSNTPVASPSPQSSASAAPSPGPSSNAACPYAGTFSGPLTDGRFTPPLVSTYTETVTCSPPNDLSVSWSDPSYGTGSFSGTYSGLTATLANGQVIDQYSADYNTITATESNSSQTGTLTRTGP